MKKRGDRSHTPGVRGASPGMTVLQVLIARTLGALGGVMSNITMLGLVLGVLLTAALLVIVILIVKVRGLGRQVADFPQREAVIRSDARKRSRTVHMASISEQLAPLLSGFRYNPKDVQWIGGHAAIDAVVWNGLEAGGDIEIVFLDVKTGPHAHLTSNQRRIREAITWKRIAFDEYRPPQTPLLTEALPPEQSDDDSVPLPEDQVEEETDRQVRAYAGIESEPVDIPESFMREVIAAGGGDS